MGYCDNSYQEMQETAMKQVHSDSDSIVFPSNCEDWEDWNRIAFQRCHSRVFVKLGTWLMLRFRQLAGISNDDEIEGLLIPDHPSSFEIANDANYHEALGMHNLFSAISSMESHPQYLAHIFHEVGKASAEGRLGNSHPGVRSVPEPPTPVQRYVNINRHAKSYFVCSSMEFTEGLGWLRCRDLTPDHESSDQDADIILDNEDNDVSTALNEMDISGAHSSADPADSLEALKRKRSMSSTFSPPKVNQSVDTCPR